MPEKRYRIAYLSVDDPRDVHVWSGSHHSIYKTLEKHFGDVELLGPYENKAVNFLLKLKKLFYKVFTGKRYNNYHSKLLSKAYARYFSAKLQNKSFDFIIAVSASCELAYLNPEAPVVFVSDALFSGSLNYHKTLSNLAKSSAEEGLEIEKRALDKAQLLYLCSDWAKSSAMNDFHVPPAKIEVGPFGANLTGIPSAENVMNYKAKKDASVINLVFIGVNWENKGGQVAADCLEYLVSKGYKAQLSVIGCTAPQHIKHPNLINIPFIHKTTAEGQKQFRQVYLDADFLVLPTRFEAYGLVFCEASAFGVISLSSNTGGIPTPVKDGVNGFLLDPGSPGAAYAEKIISAYNDKMLLDKMQKSARERYDTVLNWDAWALNLKKHLLERKIIK